MRRTLSLLLFSLVVSGLQGFENVDTAAQFSKGQLRMIFCKTTYDLNPAFQFTNPEKVKVKTLSGDIQYLSNTQKEILYRNYGERIFVKFVFNPLDELYWWVKIGAVSANVEVLYNNRISNDVYGLLAGIGAKYAVFPETMVTPGINFDFGVMAQENSFNRFYDGSSYYAVRNKFETVETQASLLISKNITKKIEPYCGISVVRYYGKLADETCSEMIDGTKDDASVFAGARIKVFPLEWFIVETKFIGEKSVSIGFGWGY
jgi:hypothetical protein